MKIIAIFRKLIEDYVFLACIKALTNIRNAHFQYSLKYKQLQRIKKATLSIFKRVPFPKL